MREIPDAAPRRRRHALARYHGGGEHDIDRIGRGGRQHDGTGGQGIDGGHYSSFHAMAFSSKVSTGSRQENASKQKSWSPVVIQSGPNKLCGRTSNVRQD